MRDRESVRERKNVAWMCFSPVSLYRPEPSDFFGTVGTRSERLLFFPVQNRGGIRTGPLAGTVYTSRTNRYSTVLSSLK